MSKTIGIVLLVIGLILGGIGLAKQSSDNEVLELGNLEIERDMSKNINWMIIAGGVLLVSGVVVLVVKRAA